MEGRKVILLTALLCLATASMAQKYRINGYVLDDEGNLPNVNIKEISGKWLGVTDMKGHFDMRTNADSIEFSYIGYQSQKIAASQGSNVVIQLVPNAAVEEVTVSAKYVNESIGKVPPVAKGNWMPYEIPIIIPKHLFRGNNRFVFQPTLTNLSEGKSVRLKPLVLDGKKYDATQRRMYDGKIQRDPLSSYVQVADHSVVDSGRIALIYRDTVYVNHPRDVFSLNIYKSYENYRKVIKLDSLPDYIRGAINPLKFLNFNVNARSITDSAYFPRPNRQFMDTEGNVNLRYLIGRSDLNMKDSLNRKELDRLERELKMLEGEEGVTLQSFSITGVASPDGGYERNRQLASARMRVALNYIVSRLNPQTRALIELHSDARVAPWDSIVPLLRRDSHNELADQVADALAKHKGNPYQQWNTIRTLNGYKDLIAGKYLPMMRTSRYKYTYSIFRNRNIPEIRAAYAAGKLLSPFEYWKLYGSETNYDVKEKICREALKKYPDFMMAANDLAVVLIQKGQADDRLLEPFIGKLEVPDEVKINHIIALLQHQRYSDAYTVVNGPLRKNDDTRLIRAFVNAMNNDITPEDQRLIEGSGTMNKVLMMLNEGKNKEALSLIMGMEVLDAKGYYIKAICCSRNNLMTLARESLQRALSMDPKLENTARGDADVYEVYKGLKEK